VVAGEAAIGIEERDTADHRVVRHPLLVEAHVLEVAEGLARREQRLVLIPAARERRDVIELPARLAER